jgi:hypothetical protein
VYLRKTDGSPAVRLGDGSFGSLSPDGQWVAARHGHPASLVLLPTGVGEPKQLTDDKTEHFNVAWMPDGKAIVYTAAEPGHKPRVYLLPIEGGTPRALTPEGSTGSMITPDGKFLFAADEKHQPWRYPIAGGEAEKVNVVPDPKIRVIGLFDGGKSVLVRTVALPVEITRVDIATGRREPFREIAPADLGGVQGLPVIKFSADGKAYAYSAARMLSDLYVVDGLK